MVKYIAPFLFACIIFGCTGDGEAFLGVADSVDQEEEEGNGSEGDLGGMRQQAKLYRIEQLFFYDELFEGSKVSYFEDNKRTLDSIFDEEDKFSFKIVYDYNPNGLQERITEIGADGEKSSEIRLAYDQLDRISQITWAENTLQGLVSSTDRMMYEDDEILVQRRDMEGNETYRLAYSLNEHGLIYRQDNGDTVFEVAYDGNLPITKRTIEGSSEEVAEFTYLDDPLPSGPWSKFWEHQVGNANNQLIFHFDGGLFTLGNGSDLSKYLESDGNRWFSYGFDDNGLPVSVRQRRGVHFTDHTIEYVQ